jgi:integration host factor subunit beta
VNKTELIASLTDRFRHLPAQDVDRAVRTLLETLTNSLSAGERIEIRGFGSFSLHHRSPRIGRNPKTGAAVAVEVVRRPHFRPGKELRERVDYPRGQRGKAFEGAAARSRLDRP